MAFYGYDTDKNKADVSTNQVYIKSALLKCLQGIDATQDTFKTLKQGGSITDTQLKTLTDTSTQLRALIEKLDVSKF